MGQGGCGFWVFCEGRRYASRPASKGGGYPVKLGMTMVATTPVETQCLCLIVLKNVIFVLRRTQCVSTDNKW